MDERDRAADLLDREARRAIPSARAGSRAIQERIAWMTRMSASRVMTVSPPARSSRASAAMKRSVLWIQSISGELQASTLISLRQKPDEMMRGGVIEANGAADHRRRRAAAAVHAASRSDR